MTICIRRRCACLCNIIALSVGLSTSGVVGAQSATHREQSLSPSLQTLREGFRNPPQEARLRCYWWWLNGSTDKATITHDLEEMRTKGFGGALLVDANGSNQNGNQPVPAGPTFGSPEWVELFTHALREADRLGLEITFNITSGWNLGGPDVTPEQASKILTYSRAQFAGGSHIHGMGVQAESGGPHGAPIDALETFRHAAVPQTEFWSPNPHRNTDSERFFTKEAASAANIYGQRLVAQEGETSIGPQWSERLATDLKPSFDMAITEGTNRLVWHEFTSSPASTGLPGQEYFAGTHLNPKVTWWNAGGAFFDYLNRTQFLMQQGSPVNDVLYFYGDNVPAFVRLAARETLALRPALPTILSPLTVTPLNMRGASSDIGRTALSSLAHKILLPEGV